MGTSVNNWKEKKNKIIFEQQTCDKLRLKRLLEEYIRTTALQCLGLKAENEKEEIQQNWDLA